MLTRNTVARFAAIVAGTVLMTACTAWAQQDVEPSTERIPEKTITAEQFHKAVRFVYDRMLERSPDPFQAFTQQEFEAEVGRLTSRSLPIAEAEVFVELSKLIGMMRDGHSWASLDSDTLLFSKAVPLRFYDFSDGLHVTAAPPELADLVGAKVVAVNDAPIETAWPQILESVGGGGGIAAGRAPVYALMPDFLRAAGLGASNNQISFTFEMPDGQTVTRILEAKQHETYDNLWQATHGLTTPEGWVEPAAARQAAWYKRHEDAFWYEHQRERKTVYAQFNVATTDPENPWNPQDDAFRPMLTEIFQLVQRPDVERLVIDLRNNNGGNSALYQPLVHGVIRTEKLYEPGRLFVIIGSATESAAVAWAAELEQNTRGVFVGQPTASPPNFFNDSDGPRRKRYDVPHTSLNIFIANMREYWSWTTDNRAAIYPDIPVSMTWSDFATGRDPAMEAILKITHEQANAFFTDSDGDPILERALWANYRRRSQDPAREPSAWRR